MQLVYTNTVHLLYLKSPLQYKCILILSTSHTTIVIFVCSVTHAYTYVCKSRWHDTFILVDGLAK